MESKVSIILLNYNWLKFNTACIESILQQSYKDFEIVFVDNASTDWSLEKIEDLYHNEINTKKIMIIKNNQNTWFTGGNNLWVKHADEKSEYICLLNNDTTVPKNWLEELVKGIQSDKNLWAVGSLLLDKGYEEEICNQIFKDKKKFVLSVFGETVIDRIKESELQHNLLYTNGISGCCFLYKKNIIDKPFEDYYFAYAEDVYLSWKIIWLGYSLGICINSVVHHFWSWSFGKTPSHLKLFHGNKNQIINFLVFYTIWYKILLFPLFFIKEIWHLFIWHAFLRIRAKLEWCLWIFKNRSKVKETQQNIQKNRSLSNKRFINTMLFKVSDISYFNKQNKIVHILLRILNTVFLFYGKCIKSI